MSLSVTRSSPIVFSLLLCSAQLAVPAGEGLAKPAGPLGVWNCSNGLVYQAPGIADSTSLQAAFSFGDFWLSNDPSIEGIPFRQWIETTCEDWKVERVIGIMRPVIEGGLINVPGDTALYEPSWPAGMIQAAARFSRLSKIHGPIGGIAIDDFAWPDTGRVRDLAGLDTASVRDIRDALKGKQVDVRGIVHHDTPETTPQLKLLVVVYAGNTIDPEYLPFFDGVSLWITNQNTQYTNIDSYVDHCRTFYPGKEINCGIYVANSIYGWMTPASLEHMYRRLLDRYDDGDVNGIPLFCGHWLVMPNITRERWDADRLPALLDEVYYPFVGAGRGRVLDQRGAPVEGAFVTCTTIGRVSGELLARSRKRSDADGRFDFDAWAGNRSTESTLYFVVAEKDGQVSAPVAGWIHRGGESGFPDLRLPVPAGLNDQRTAELTSERPPGLDGSPNPLRESTVIRYSVTRGERLRLRVLDLGGREVGTLAEAWCPPGECRVIWDGRDRWGERAPSGLYLLRLESGCGEPRATGRVLVVR